jgi:hypothetical protein
MPPSALRSPPKQPQRFPGRPATSYTILATCPPAAQSTLQRSSSHYLQSPPAPCLPKTTLKMHPREPPVSAACPPRVRPCPPRIRRVSARVHPYPPRVRPYPPRIRRVSAPCPPRIRPVSAACPPVSARVRRVSAPRRVSARVRPSAARSLPQKSQRFPSRPVTSRVTSANTSAPACFSARWLPL